MAGHAKPMIENDTALQQPGHGIKKLSELPGEIWTQVPNDINGYQFLVNAHIGAVGKSKPYLLMADGGSGVNTIPEKTLVEILNQQKAAGIKLSDKRHPVVQL